MRLYGFLETPRAYTVPSTIYTDIFANMRCPPSQAGEIEAQQTIKMVVAGSILLYLCKCYLFSSNNTNPTWES